MAIYTGFFDAAFDENLGGYDRVYGSSDFVGYFEEFIGSGVCVYNNENSMQVTVDEDSLRAVVAPGYLFIRGYWLKNDGPYTVNLSNLMNGTYAIYAHLDLSTRTISIDQMLKANPEEYHDSLVLAYLTVNNDGTFTVEDTRDNSNICGLIDSAGNLSIKLNYAINYIDQEIDTKLDSIEKSLKAQEAVIDEKIGEANSLIEKILPPPLGTLKFSVNPTVEEGWLKCDGSYITGKEYPDLVTLLGKVPSTAFDQKVLKTYKYLITQSFTGLVFWENYAWFCSGMDGKLFGISLEDLSIKEVSLFQLNSLGVKQKLTFSQGSYYPSFVKNNSQTLIYFNPSGGFVTLAEYGSSNKDDSLVTTQRYSYLFGGEFSPEQEEVIFESVILSHDSPSSEYKYATGGYYRSTTSATSGTTYSFKNDFTETIYPKKPLKYTPSGEPYFLVGYTTWSRGSPLGINYGNYVYYRTYFILLFPLRETKGSLVYVLRSELESSIANNNNNTTFLGNSVFSNSLMPYWIKGYAYNLDIGAFYIDRLSGYYSLFQLEGEIKKEISRVSTFNPDNSWKNSSLALYTTRGEEDYLVVKYVIAGILEVHAIKISTLTPIRVTIPDYVSLSPASKYGGFGEGHRIFYSPSLKLWIFVEDYGIFFSSHLEDPSQYTYKSTYELFPLGYIDQESPANKALVHFDGDRTLYYLFGDNNYNISLGKIEFPENFNPLDGTNLPNITINHIPAYIKAKEPEVT